MSSDPISAASPLLRKLASIHPLTPKEQAALAALPIQLRKLGARQDIVREGDRPSRSFAIVQGWTVRYKSTGRDGRQQILAFHMAGDMPDLMSLQLSVMDNSIGTLVPSELAFIEHEPLRRLIREHPRICDALWRETLVDAAVGREWMIRLGARSAYRSVANLVCELFVRMKAVGLVNGMAMDLPATQGTIGDALGLSTVHVNRVIQQMRRDRLVTWSRGVLTILDWAVLQEAGEFDPAYLHLQRATDPQG